MTSPVLFRAERLLSLSASVGPVLGIDTATRVERLAIVAAGTVAGTLSQPARSHGATLPEAVERLLGGAGLRARDLAAVAVGIGPGSFTGLRVGLSYAKGLALASGCRLVGIPGLDGLAVAALGCSAAKNSELVCSLLDARKGEVYAALYRVAADGLEKVSGYCLVRLGSLADRIDSSVVFAGDSKAQEAAVMVAAKGLRTTVLNDHELERSGVCLAAIGAAGVADGRFDSVATLEPLYVRPPEATLKLVAPERCATSQEEVWNPEKRNSFSSTWVTTKN